MGLTYIVGVSPGWRVWTGDGLECWGRGKRCWTGLDGGGALQVWTKMNQGLGMVRKCWITGICGVIEAAKGLFCVVRECSVGFMR
jgi:hypothetical protein